jgi:hypothetical protein
MPITSLPQHSTLVLIQMQHHRILTLSTISQSQIIMKTTQTTHNCSSNISKHRINSKAHLLAAHGLQGLREQQAGQGSRTQPHHHHLQGGVVWDWAASSGAVTWHRATGPVVKEMVQTSQH